MRKYLASRNAAFFAAGGFIAALFLGGAAHAITDTAFQYSTPHRGYLGFPPAAFAPGNGGNTFYNVFNSGTVLQVANNQTCVNAPVNLPNRATMTDLFVRYGKTTGTAEITLVTSEYSTNAATILLDVSLADTSNQPTNIGRSISNAAAKVDNGHNSYWLRFCADNSTYFNNMRIGYTYTNAGD
jgi:hypothetical protein